MWGYYRRCYASDEQLEHMAAYTDPITFFSDPELKKSNPIHQERYVEDTAALVQASMMQHAVLLASAKPYDGGPTHLYTSNSYVQEKTEKHPELLFGASINPQDPDAILKLEEAVRNGAVLNKILQNALRIDLSDPAYTEFYKKMASYGLPLLVHTGSESAIRDCGDDELGNPKKLERALDIGVKVIFSHCGTPEFYDEFLKMIQHENGYGGLSAMGREKRYKFLLELASAKELHDKLVFETDYPLEPQAELFEHRFGRRAVQGFNAMNPYDRYISILMALEFPRSVLTRGAEIIRFNPKT